MTSVIRNERLTFLSTIRIFLQKQLLICNIDELYKKFKLLYPDMKVGKNSYLASSQCILVGDSGTYSVCVYHQDIRMSGTFQLSPLATCLLLSTAVLPSHEFVERLCST